MDEGVIKVLFIDKDEVVVVLSSEVVGRGVLVGNVGTITELHGGGGVYRISEGVVALTVAIYVYSPSTVT